MAKVYLITINDIKKESIITDNTDDKILSLALGEVTDLELEPLVGVGYLSAINQRVIDKTLTDTDKEVIKNVIKPFLVYGTVAYSIQYLHNKVGNKGVVVSTDATISAKSTKDVDSFQQQILMKFDSYKKRLINYFKNDNDENTKTSIGADTTLNTLGVYIPDAIDNSERYYRARANKRGL